MIGLGWNIMIPIARCLENSSEEHLMHINSQRVWTRVCQTRQNLKTFALSVHSVIVILTPSLCQFIKEEDLVRQRHKFSASFSDEMRYCKMKIVFVMNMNWVLLSLCTDDVILSSDVAEILFRMTFFHFFPCMRSLSSSQNLPSTSFVVLWCFSYFETGHSITIELLTIT